MSEPTTVRYEKRDISPRGVLSIGFGVLLATLVIISCLYFLFSYMRNLKAGQSPPASPLAPRVSTVPPEPRLQENPSLDYQSMRDQAKWELNHYKWIDKQKGIAAIPIDRAIDIIAHQGIPPSSEPPARFYTPQQGDRLTGFEERKEPEP